MIEQLLGASIRLLQNVMKQISIATAISKTKRNGEL